MKLSLNQISLAFFITLLNFTSISQTSTTSSKILVGILEDDRAEKTSGPTKNRVVRPLFEKKGNEWQLSTIHPEPLQWIIALQGEKVGAIKSRSYGKTTQDTPLYKDTHVVEAQPGQSLVFGKPSEVFGGWVNKSFNRPLVLVSKNNYSDPEKWKPLQPTHDQIKLFKSAFRTEYPKVFDCDESGQPSTNSWDYKDSDIKIENSFGSKSGDTLVSMFLESDKCDAPPDGPFSSQTFLYSPNQKPFHVNLPKIHRIPDADNDLLLIFVDAGDYDADGKSEVIFFVLGYNEDGFAIFYDSFKKSVFHTWHYN